jgi:hypothetical protein
MQTCAHGNRWPCVMCHPDPIAHSIAGWLEKTSSDTHVNVKTTANAIRNGDWITTMSQPIRPFPNSWPSTPGWHESNGEIVCFSCPKEDDDIPEGRPVYFTVGDDEKCYCATCAIGLRITKTRPVRA